MKKIVLTVEDMRKFVWIDKTNSFRVKSVTNSIEYQVGEYLTKDAVAAACKDETVEVKIVEATKG
jgi:hypothetical protein